MCGGKRHDSHSANVTGTATIKMIAAAPASSDPNSQRGTSMKMAPMKREKFRHKPIGFVGTERDFLANKAVLHSQRCHDFDPGAVLGGHLGALRLLARRQTAVAVLRVVTRTKAGLEVFPEQIGLTE